jgi:hypothetical protein
VLKDTENKEIPDIPLIENILINNGNIIQES